MDEPITAKIETFEGFQYAVQVGKPATNDSYYISFSVAGDFPRERTPGEDEKPEDKERLDKEFNDKLAKLEEKLKKEKAFEPWTYLVSKWTVDPVLRDRKDLLIQPKDEDEKTEVPPTPKPETSIAPPPSEELPPLPGFEVD